MISWSRILLFIGILVFLIYNHKSQICKRQKNRGSHTQDNIILLFCKLFLPYFYPLCIRKLRVVYAKSVSENFFETFCYLCSKSYFRKQIQYLFTGLEYFMYKVNINLCFTT